MMINKKLVLALLVLHLVHQASVAQQFTTPPVIPPTPDAAALGKYGLYPVSLANGLVDVDIPLYTIKTNGIQLPVSLSYHASGIKVDEVCSWVGAGWVLNAGGVITRVVKEKPDAKFGEVNQVLDRALYNSLSSANDLFSALDYVAGGVDGVSQDLESDIYYYNVGGVSGSFRYNTQGELIQLPLSNNKIEYNDAVDEFVITGTDGTVYKFSDKEKTKQGTLAGVDELAFTSSWYLTSITTPYSENILFSYVDDTSNYEEWSEGFDLSVCASGDCSAYFGSATGVKTKSVVKTELTKVLSSITFPGGRIGFIRADDRIDRRKYRLTAISITDNANKQIKSVALEHSYFTPIGSGTTSGSGVPRDNNYRDHYEYRLKLDKITVGDEKYTFDYDTKERLPHYYNPAEAGLNSYYGQDPWGYNNGVTTNSNFNTSNPERPVPVSAIPIADRSINEKAAQAGILNKVTYPTGGFTEFTYESNRGIGNILVGGLRIHKITSYDNAGSKLVKTYKYESPLANFGDLSEITGAIYSQDVYSTSVDKPGHSMPLYVLNHYISAPPTPLTYSGGPAVFYDKVIEFTGTETDYVGKTVYSFEIIQDFEFNGTNLEYGFPSTFYLRHEYDNFNFSWRRGQPKGTLIYSTTNGVDKLVKSISNYYSEYLYNIVKVGFWAFKTRIAMNNNIEVPDDIVEVKTRCFQYDDVRIKTGIKKLIRTVETTYSDRGDVINTSRYFYDRLDKQYEMSSTTQEESDGSVLKKTFTYPNDLKTDSPTDIYRLMSEKNMISPAVIENKQKDDKMVESIRTSYWDWNNGIYAPKKIEVKVGENNYQTRLDYFAYDNYGNVLSMQNVGGVKQEFIWGYQNMVGINPQIPSKLFPVVSVQGPCTNGITELRNVIQGYAFTGAVSYAETKTDVDYLNSQLSTLRNTAGCLITSYTYSPLVGVTSATGAGGVTTYYEYDGEGRLNAVRDNNGKYVKMYEYKIVGQ